MKKVTAILLLLLLFLPSPSYAAWTVIAHTTACSGDTQFTTTTGINTTGADLIYINVAAGVQTGSSFVDSYSNTWTELTERDATNITRTFYVKNPITGTGHTFTYSTAPLASFSNIQAIALSGSGASPKDQENGAGNSSTASLATGSITPSQDGEIVITGMQHDNAVTVAIDSSFTIQDQTPSNGSSCVGGALAYKIQTTATPVNPTWSWTGTTHATAEIVSFKGLAVTGPVVGSLASTGGGR